MTRPTPVAARPKHGPWPPAGPPPSHWLGLICAYRLDGNGGGRRLGWRDLETRAPVRPSLTWVHLDLKHPNALRWLREDSGLTNMDLEALTARHVTPHLVRRGESTVLILRGLNLAGNLPGQLMPALRLWTDGHSLISARREHIHATRLIRDALDTGTGPHAAGDFLAVLADLTVGHMEDMIAAMMEQTHRIGHAGEHGRTEELVAELAHLRRRMIAVKRHLGPQQRALARLTTSPVPWLKDHDRWRLRAVVDQCRQYLDGIDAAQQTTAITQDEILQRSTERTERRLFSLTVITAIFLPLTFITGLLGVNLAGIPEAGKPWSFLALCGLLALIAGLQLWFLRRKGWL